MSSLTRRSLVRGVVGAAPAAVLLGQAEGALGAADARDRADLARVLAKDMIGRHQGRMHGVPRTYNWAKGPRIGRGNHPGKYQAMSVWGQIYEDADGSPATNVRVACRDIQGWILSKRTGRWRRVVGSRDVFGANYLEDFSGNASVPADLRSEPGDAVSATLGNGYNFHFFPKRQRKWIDPHDIAGVVTLYSARVVMDDPHGPDERHLARYLASAGGDYWLDRTCGSRERRHRRRHRDRQGPLPRLEVDDHHHVDHRPQEAPQVALRRSACADADRRGLQVRRRVAPQSPTPIPTTAPPSPITFCEPLIW